MKNKILPFTKKYPMSILLAIIALNLLSIAASLKTEAEINKQRLTCIKYKKDQIDRDTLFRRLNVPKDPVNVKAVSLCGWILD